MIYNPGVTKEYTQYTDKENISFVDALTEEDKVRVSAILNAADKINKSISSISLSHGRADFVLAISQIGDFPIKTQEFGQVENFERARVYSHLNIETIATNPGLVSSSEKDPSPDHIGAVVFGKWILSVSGFSNPNMNAATAVGIAFGAGLINYQEAEKLVHNPSINCVSEYMENEDAFTDPFWGHTKANSRETLLPHQDI